MTVKLTIHGAERAKERLGAKGKSLHSQVERAWTKGKTIDQFDKKSQRYYLNAADRSTGEYLRVFGGQLFLFGKETSDTVVLITTFPIPDKVRKAQQRRG